MFRKPLFLKLFTVLFLALMVACVKSPQVSEIVAPTSLQSLETVEVPTSTIQPTKTGVIPTPTVEETRITETEVEDLSKNTSNPCDNLGGRYNHDEELGEIKEEYIGSWHASAFVGSAYTERYVFFSSGNYLFFPSQYDCEINDMACVPSPIEEGIWGIREGQMNLAKEGDINDFRSILVGKVINAPPDESPYPLKTTFDGTTYWLLSKDTNLWNPETGELCD